MAAKKNPRNRDNELVVKEYEGELLLYDLIVHKAYVLNETAALVWNLCDGNNSVADISRKLSIKLKQPVTDDLVWLSLEKLKKDNLLAASQELKIDFGGLSRREVVRKIGFASLVTLPAVASLVAPTAAMGASCLAPGTYDGVCQRSGGSCSSFATRCCSKAADSSFGCPSPPRGYTPPPGITQQCRCS